MSDVEVSKKAIAKELLERGKKNGMLSFKEIMDAFEVVDIGPDQIDKIYETIEKAGIEIVGDIDKELEEIELASEEEIEDLSVPEGVNIDDHVKMYLKEIGKVPLLDADEEIELAKRMAEGRSGGKTPPCGGESASCS